MPTVFNALLVVLTEVLILVQHPMNYVSMPYVIFKCVIRFLRVLLTFMMSEKFATDSTVFNTSQ